MQSFVVALLATLPAVIVAAPTPAGSIDANMAVNIPPACGVCDGFGAGCLAACIAGGPLDPICDVCAGPAIGTCLSVSESVNLPGLAEQQPTNIIVPQPKLIKEMAVKPRALVNMSALFRQLTLV